MDKKEITYTLKFPPTLGIPDKTFKVSDLIQQVPDDGTGTDGLTIELIETVPVLYKRDDTKELLGITYENVNELDKWVPPLRTQISCADIDYVVDQIDYNYEPKREIIVYLKQV
jgi:hypothetical protein